MSGQISEEIHVTIAFLRRYMDQYRKTGEGNVPEYVISPPDLLSGRAEDLPIFRLAYSVFSYKCDQTSL